METGYGDTKTIGGGAGRRLDHDRVHAFAREFANLNADEQRFFLSMTSAVETKALRENKSLAMQEQHSSAGGGSEELSLENVDQAFKYQPWDPFQQQSGDVVREALVAAAKAILRTVPRTPSRTRALNAVMDARMLANQAITFCGRF